MNGVHDMGGLHGFRPVQWEENEPLFHAPWERRTLGLTLAMGATGQWNIDQCRSARGSLAPTTYRGSICYRIRILALKRLMLEQGLVTAAEPASGRAEVPARPVARVLQAAAVDATLARGTPTERTASALARFAVGDRVRAVNRHPAGHTRLPRCVRGHTGTVAMVHGTHVFADRHAASAPGQPFDDAPQWLYAVVFDGHDLWGADAEPGLRISVDAWESHLEPVTPTLPRAS